MRILFLHQNFPAQFRHVSEALFGRKGVEVIAVTHEGNRRRFNIPTRTYAFEAASLTSNVVLAAHYTQRIARAAAVAPALDILRREGFAPDLVIGHGGWGETLFVNDVWPGAKILLHAEFYYSATGADVDFDPEFCCETEIQSKIRIRAQNTIMLQALFDAYKGVTSMHWQAAQFPQNLAQKISIVHEGIDTDKAAPNPSTQLTLAQDRSPFCFGDEIITFASRNLEPYRGYHIFMRALPRVLKQRPNARVVIIGGDEEGYGPAPPANQTWRSIFFDEVREKLDTSRIHFVGRVEHEVFTRLIQVSAVHVYLTYPFVLSWSLLEAMSAGALIVASRTPPVEEVIEDGKNGFLAPFFDVEALSDKIMELLSSRQSYADVRASARQTILERYDLKTKCLPAWLTLINELVEL